MANDREDPLYVREEDLQRLLSRAVELENAQRVSVARLREIAAEAGIRQEAIDAAVRELHSSTAVGESTRMTPPWWVRVCLFGVPDRAAALVYYWLFLGGMVAIPAAHVLTDSISRGAALTAAGVCGFALWSTSRAIHWLDSHGWASLRSRPQQDPA